MSAIGEGAEYTHYHIRWNVTDKYRMFDRASLEKELGHLAHYDKSLNLKQLKVVSE